MSELFPSVFPLPNPDRKCPYGQYDFGKKSLAVVVCDGNGEGVVLWHVGGWLDLEIKEYGFSRLDELGLDNAPHGISVWEGIYVYHSCRTFEYDEGAESESKGEFRPPNDEEWLAIREGRNPWNDAEWKLPWDPAWGPEDTEPEGTEE